MNHNYRLSFRIFFIIPFIVFLLGIFSTSVSSMTDEPQPQTGMSEEEIYVRDTVKIGIYITSIYDLLLAEQSFNTDFWMWFNYTNDSIKPMETAEISNAKDFSFVLPDVEKKDNIIWGTQKCRAVIKQLWDVRRFPYDEQYLNITIEDIVEDTSALIFIVDSANSKIDKAVILDGWRIKDFHISSGVRTYETTYGDPTLSDVSAYSSVNATITIKRKGTGLFIKLFTGVYVAFVMSMLVFFLDPIDLDPRFGLAVGAMFAAVGNKYIVDSIMPQTVALTLVDKIHGITFVYIVLCVIISLISLFYYKKGKINLSQKLDVYSFFFLLITFIIINYYFISNAIAPN